ncbi:hypothetical protein [Streptomyces sp. NPDC097619]|uniref:hypothetical protein n=1 Tax=Streptomyces sp. NPDC097619 TaxID=3157228 RepID=UPI00332E794E
MRAASSGQARVATSRAVSCSEPSVSWTRDTSQPFAAPDTPNRPKAVGRSARSKSCGTVRPVVNGPHNARASALTPPGPAWAGAAAGAEPAATGAGAGAGAGAAYGFTGTAGVTPAGPATANTEATARSTPITATVYAHVRFRLQRDAIDTLSTALGSSEAIETVNSDRNEPPPCSTLVR